VNEEQKAGLLDRLIAMPVQRTQLLDEAGATADERTELLELADIADAAWVSTRGAPPVEEDPIAAMLGIAPTPGLAIDPAAFKQARVRSGLNVSQLRDRLAQRGWQVSNGEIASWQSREGIELLPALLQDIGDALSVSADSFTVTRVSDAPTIHTILRKSDWFVALVEQWQTLRHVARSVAEAQLLTRATATVHRGEEPDVDQIRELLEHLVASSGESGSSRQ